MRHAVILAGGGGTRLWPLSRRSLPKQFAPLGANGESLLAAAIRRGEAIAGGRVMIVTAASQVEPTHEVTAALGGPAITVLAEPVGRNTAAAIGLAAATLLKTDPDAVIAVLPADQRISDEPGFATVADVAFSEVERTGAIGTLGIVPTRAETGFGYLEVARVTLGVATPVVKFVEKPDRATAEGYVAGGRHLWNAGIFFASASRLLAELNVRMPQIAMGVGRIAAGLARADEIYPTLPSISIDHAVMEKAEHVVTVPAAIGWDDLGSWEAIAQVLGHTASDQRANVTLPLHPHGPRPLAFEADRNVLLSTDDTLIVAYGVTDLVVAKVGNVVLVVPRAMSQSVRNIVDELEKRGLDKYL